MWVVIVTVDAIRKVYGPFHRDYDAQEKKSELEKMGAYTTIDIHKCEPLSPRRKGLSLFGGFE